MIFPKEQSNYGRKVVQLCNQADFRSIFKNTQDVQVDDDITGQLEECDKLLGGPQAVVL